MIRASFADVTKNLVTSASRLTDSSNGAQHICVRSWLGFLQVI